VTAGIDLYLRCDGSARLGLGHVVRSVALAEAAARRRMLVRFVMREDAHASDIPRAHGFPVDVLPAALPSGEEAAWLAARASGTPRAWFVVDGYHLGGLVPALRARGARVCAVCDDPAGPGAAAQADLLVNPSPAAITEADADGRRLLVGPRYAPLRASFRRARLGRTTAGQKPWPRLLLLSGGSDVAGLTVRVLGALRAAAALPPFEIVIVLGPSSPAPPPELVVGEVVRAPRDMAALMASADLAITAAGTSVLELACLGVPALMVTVVGNQAGVAAALEAAGAGLDLGPCDALTPPALLHALARAARERDAWSAAARALVDGGGARRVVAALCRLQAEETP